MSSPEQISRRDLLSMLGGAAALQALTGCTQPSETPTANRKASDPLPPDIDFATALEVADAIQKKKVSSVELTRRMFDRIDRYNPQLNAFVYQLRNEAMEQAKKADEAVARGQTLGVFHGVPIHVKESFAVAGRPCTWGIPELRDSKAPRNSQAVERLVNAGAVLIGATNVPVNLSDWQSYNPIYGSTNNPWDLKRTPGGSSGGTAAALAAGIGYLSVGSDIGGSIRVPSHFCGTFGHKPTLELVSLDGHQPGGNPGLPGFSTLLAVGGPMARSAEDLLAALKVLGGPDGWDAKAWKWDLPASRKTSLKDFRVGYVLEDSSAPLTAEVKAVLDQAIGTLQRAGATVKQGWPAGYKHADLLSTYVFMLFAFLYSASPPNVREGFRIPGNPTPPGAAPFADWQAQNIRRLEFRAQWQKYFKEVDVFLSAVTPSEAFTHDHSEPIERRMISTSMGPMPYLNLFNWIAPASLTGCPATVAPVGKTPSGLPVGIQIMGPYWEDATPITFAQLLARETGGFTPPPGYTT